MRKFLGDIRGMWKRDKGNGGLSIKSDEGRALSALQRRILAGKADPISDREREQLAEIRDMYYRRFGKFPE